MDKNSSLRKPTVTVIIAVYNGERYVNSCLTSVRQQTYTDYEVVIINDGSTDGTQRELNKWQNVFTSRLLLLANKRNIGLTKSLNIAIQRARGQYIARLDIDDRWHQDKLKRQMSFLATHSRVGLLGCQYVTKHFGVRQVSSLPLTNREIKASIFSYNPFCHSGIVLEKQLWQKVGGYDNNIRYAQDLDLWFRLLPDTKMANLPDLLCYRRSNGSLSVRHPHQQSWQSIKTKLKYLRVYHLPARKYLDLKESVAVWLTPIVVKRIYYAWRRGQKEKKR